MSRAGGWRRFQCRWVLHDPPLVAGMLDGDTVFKGKSVFWADLLRDDRLMVFKASVNARSETEAADRAWRHWSAMAKRRFGVWVLADPVTMLLVWDPEEEMLA